MSRLLKISVLLTLISFLIVSFALAEKRALTYDDIIKMYRLSEPAVSPDGKWVAYSAAKYSYETDKGNRDIFLVPVEGGEPVQITRFEGTDASPLWSPDGEKLTFVSSRSGSMQVWYINTRTMGEPVKMTDVPTGINTYKWSPDGKYILFSTEIYKGCDTFDCNEKKMKEEAENKVSAIVTDELLYRHWNYWKAGKVSHLYSMNLETGKITDLTPGERWVPFGPFDGAEQYSISPDSKTVAYSKRTGDQPAVDTNDDVYLVPIDGGASKQITSSKGSDKTPDFSPDGKYVSYIRMKRPGFEADRQELVLYSLDKNDYIDITAEYDGDVLSYLWTEDSKTIYFVSESRARRGLYKVNIDDKKVENFYNAGKVAEIALTPDQESLIYTWQDARQMYEIYRFDIDDTNPVQLTKMNAKVLEELEMNPVEDIDFRGAGGDMVHALMLKPPFFNESKKYPMILIIHGGPQNSTLDDFHLRWNLQLFASRGYVVLGINFHGSTGYGQKFKDGVTYDWGGLPFRDIMIGLDYVLLKYNFIDRNRIAAAGASYGGYMINWIAGHTDRFKCLVSHSGVYNFSSMYGSTEELWFPEFEYKGTPWTNPSYYRKDSPDTYVKRFTTPTLVIHGQQDFRVPVTQSMEFFTALQKMGVESKFIYFPDECHFVLKPNNARFWYNSVLDWIDAHTKK